MNWLDGFRIALQLLALSLRDSSYSKRSGKVDILSKLKPPFETKTGRDPRDFTPVDDKKKVLGDPGLPVDDHLDLP